MQQKGAGPARKLVPTARRQRVLIAEDHTDTREIYAWCMRAAGWHVDTVGDGLQAVVVAGATQPDVIVMDLNLPRLDGVAAIHRLRADEHTAHIPIVACTAFSKERRAEAQEAGCDELVPKPCTAEELRDVVERLAAQRVR